MIADCGMCPMLDLCEKKGFCQLFEDKCASCDEGREIEYGGIRIHICEGAKESSITFAAMCPCGCLLLSNAIVEPAP